jgi:uncharacterized membrane protein (UPF0127 family)
MAQRIVVERTGAPLATDLRLAKSVWARFRGLMLAGPLKPGEGLDINPCGSIHMMFMRFALDVVFYDKENKVTKVARNVRPWIGLSFGAKGSKGVLELPARSVGDVVPGDQLLRE